MQDKGLNGRFVRFQQYFNVKQLQQLILWGEWEVNTVTIIPKISIYCMCVVKGYKALIEVPWGFVNHLQQ